MCADGSMNFCWDASCRNRGYRVIEGCSPKSIMNAMSVRVTTIKTIEAIEISEEMTAKVC